MRGNWGCRGCGHCCWIVGMGCANKKAAPAERAAWQRSGAALTQRQLTLGGELGWIIPGLYRKAQCRAQPATGSVAQGQAAGVPLCQFIDDGQSQPAVGIAPARCVQAHEGTGDRA